MSAEDAGEHDALPGVPTPAETRSTVGHEASLVQLAAAAEAGRLHHAWLFQGPRGIGKATVAFAFARRLLSDDGDEAVAGRRIAAGAHPNLLHVKRAQAERGGFRTQITVDEVRKLNRFFQTTSGSRQWRIAIVDPVDDLNRNAANALLKILEEPPERSLFLLVNHLPGRLLPTIRSRCRVLRLEPLSEEEVASVLAALDLGLPTADLAAAASRSEGSVRNALTFATSGGLEIERRLDALLDAPDPEWHGIQSLADELAQKDRETSFDLALTSLLARLAGASEAAMDAGRGLLARELATLWREENDRFREGLLYNLDRRQLLMTHFGKRFALRATAAH